MPNVESILISEIHEDESFNSRGKVIPTDVVELAQDIDKRGLIQPVVVNAYTDGEVRAIGKKFKLIAGYRRMMAHRILQKERIDAIIRTDLGDEIGARVFNLCENLQRANLTFTQEAESMRMLRNLGLTEQNICDQLNKSRGWVQVRVLYLKLPEEVQEVIAAGMIAPSKVRDLYTIYRNKGREDCISLARDFKDEKITGKKRHRAKYKQSSPTAKRVRSKGEIMGMLAHIQSQLPNGLYTQSLAWCGGELNDVEFEMALQEFAQKINKTYRPVDWA